LPQPSQIINNKFPFEPTAGQKEFFSLLDEFLGSSEKSKSTLLLKGYAGTGKTTVLSALVEILPLFNYRYLLMAPTGRAAKVMAVYTGKKAYTIHKRIYKLVNDPRTGYWRFQKQKGYYKNTVFIVDECSMLSDVGELGGSNVFKDLIHFIFSDDNNNRLILVGDTAQLPPVGQVESPALMTDNLITLHRLTVVDWELTEVMRQSLNSGILKNATALRNQISDKKCTFKFQTAGFNDIFKMSGERFEEGLRYAYDKNGIENTAIICRSNRSAVQYNHFIRNTILFFDNEIDVGDYLMIVKNNYYYLSDDSPAGFLANGDFVEVMRVLSFEERLGFRFSRLELRLIDYPHQEKFEALVLLETLHSSHTSLSDERQKELHNMIMEENSKEDQKQSKKMIREDPYFNALQVKFAYALTCHKSQGGQWNTVFVDQGYLKPEMIDISYMRWLYTAVTRAKQELFLVNFSPNFF